MKHKWYESIWKKLYEDYHRSYTWTKFRKLVLNRDNNRCKFCGSTEKLTCHHNSYEHFSQHNEEEMNDCITVCGKCHTYLHLNGRVRKQFEVMKENYVISQGYKKENYFTPDLLKYY